MACLKTKFFLQKNHLVEIGWEKEKRDARKKKTAGRFILPAVFV
jgi:hypothetical protein